MMNGIQERNKREEEQNGQIIKKEYICYLIPVLEASVSFSFLFLQSVFVRSEMKTIKIS